MKKSRLILLSVVTLTSWNFSTICTGATEDRSEASATAPTPPISVMGYAVGGPDDILAKSQKCIYSVYDNLSRELHVEGPNHLQKVKTRMHKMLGDKQISFKLTLKPNGQIDALEVLKSSGSAPIDEQFKELVLSASPFAANSYPEKLTWILRFPEFNLQPSWIRPK